MVGWPGCGAATRTRCHGVSSTPPKHLNEDDEVALIGSSNLDIRSFALNAEVSVLIYDRSRLTDSLL